MDARGAGFFEGEGAGAGGGAGGEDVVDKQDGAALDGGGGVEGA